jgi:alpha-mannosidase
VPPLYRQARDTARTPTGLGGGRPEQAASGDDQYGHPRGAVVRVRDVRCVNRATQPARVACSGVLFHREYARERVAQTAARLAARVHADRAPLALEIAGPVGRIRPDDLEFRAARAGEPLGPLFATHWLRAHGTVPEDWAGSRVDVLLDTGGEATLWLAGRPVQGLNSGPRMVRPSAALLHAARGGEPVELELGLAANDLYGYGETGQGLRMEFALRRCELARFDAGAWAAWHDLELLRELELQPGLDPDWAGELLAGLHAYTLDEDPARLAALLAHRAHGLHALSAVGHAHLDTAWLWPLEETQRKLVRTTANQLRLLDAYPEHVFCHSQAQHYVWLAEREPELFAAVKAAVAAGRWVPVGGTWVEPDTNLPSGESLARQLLYGQRFFERELGRRCSELWIPDVFGYTAQLPQLMRGAGISRFLTQKLSWNRYTKPEHHTFTWRGLDGSEVLTHFPPADTYSTSATVAEIRGSAAAYHDHGRSHHSLLAFGHGDGGGGPTAEMLERLRRARDLAGLPRTTIRSPEAFFDDLEEDARDLRTVVGELYFEMHRGTYTSHAALKRGNRRGEAALRDAELVAAVAARASGVPYPRDELRALWQTLLLNQFHDILPGSSIAEVNERARRDLDDVRAGAEAISAAVLGAPREPVNTLGFARRAVSGDLEMVAAPACGIGRRVETTDRVRVERTADGVVLTNRHLRAVLGPGGDLISLTHDAREALVEPGNRLELYVDEPVAWEAWDIDPAHVATRADCPPAAGVAAVREHPLRAEVDFEREIGERSQARQTVRLDAEGRRLEFHTVVDWAEDRRLLKVAFPLAVHADEATYEVAFGAVRRPTHASTRADLARYEVPGHRWADLSEHGFGVALLTDSTYGYSADGSTLRLSLLRAPRSPDPDADRGRHAFAYAVLPHAGGWQDGGVVTEAAAFNVPLRHGGGLPAGSWAEVDGGLVLDTLKLAEDSDDVVLRLYEPHGGRGTARVRLAPPVAEAWRASLLEEPGERLAVTDG